jgi:hypothetical protein
VRLVSGVGFVLDILCVVSGNLVALLHGFEDTVLVFVGKVV